MFLEVSPENRNISTASPVSFLKMWNMGIDNAREHAMLPLREDAIGKPALDRAQTQTQLSSSLGLASAGGEQADELLINCQAELALLHGPS